MISYYTIQNNISKLIKFGTWHEENESFEQQEQLIVIFFYHWLNELLGLVT